VANEKHLAKLKEVVSVWNEWRENHLDIRADLIDANLTVADLTGENLTNADLDGTNFNATILEGTDFHGAILDETTFVNLNLSKAKGLETCTFGGPCAIDHRTLIRGKGVRSIFIQFAMFEPGKTYKVQRQVRPGNLELDEL
jgi:hypothetical protein